MTDATTPGDAYLIVDIDYADLDVNGFPAVTVQQNDDGDQLIGRNDQGVKSDEGNVTFTGGIEFFTPITQLTYSADVDFPGADLENQSQIQTSFETHPTAHAKDWRALGGGATQDQA